jgi:AraC family transcriptional regulator, regulatory protein of adaptative response / methylated-DNA-[protein]-cysteine methyltransferase
MSETIRYAFGQSSLGDFLVAASDRGLVAFEFGERCTALVNGLRQRFPEAAVEVDEAGLSVTVGKLAAVVDQPALDPGLSLDPRGTDYQKRVWEILRTIAPGRTTTYGEIAAKLGKPRDARDATEAVAANAIAILIPCHRVVKKDGSLSGYRWGSKRKRILLAHEQAEADFLLV